MADQSLPENSYFHCAIEEARRPGWKRCSTQCPSCSSGMNPEHQVNLRRDDGRPMTTCETAGGLYFDFSDPRPEQISLDDIAHHLAQKCRFGSATADPDTGRTLFYSVADHALYVRELVIAHGHPELALAALHHDSHEYMLGDWPTPLKRLLREAGATVLDDVVRKTNVAIGEKFGIDPEDFEHPAVKRADTEALFREAAAFKRSRGVGVHWGRTEQLEPRSEPLPIGQAKSLFIVAHQAETSCR